VHKFKIGQLVELEPSLRQLLAPGGYEIRHLMPSSESRLTLVANVFS
jgi:hypothetical protein